MGKKCVQAVRAVRKNLGTTFGFTHRPELFFSAVYIKLVLPLVNRLGFHSLYFESSPCYIAGFCPLSTQPMITTIYIYNKRGTRVE